LGKPATVMPADVAGPLEDHEIVDPLALQANRGAEAAESAADDRDARVARGGFARAHGWNGRYQSEVAACVPAAGGPADRAGAAERISATDIAPILAGVSGYCEAAAFSFISIVAR
jgi:hypothetical protein